MKPRWLAATVIPVMAGSAIAHGFEERYDLPVPLSYVVVGACAAVFLTFVLAILLIRRPAIPSAGFVGRKNLLPAAFRQGLARLAQALVWLLFALTISSALWGSRDPLMNLAPTMIWIVWWIGISFAVVICGNFWPALDPWRSSFEALDQLARKLGLKQGLARNWPWPAGLDAWPAVFLLLLWSWLEVVYPLASSPLRLGCAALLWTAVNLAGMVCFGPGQWQKNADVFALYFATLGKITPGASHLEAAAGPGKLQAAAQGGFVTAMLSTVLFDGLHGGMAWTSFEHLLRRFAATSMDINGYFSGTMGLTLVWLAFSIAYLLSSSLSAILIKPSGQSSSGLQLAADFAPSLIPIAAAYNIAHNFSNLLIQGQRIFQLLSDPFGRQWDLFGTARFYPDIAVVDARMTWFVAVLSIVAGHMLSVWMAHRQALRLGLSARRTALITTPLTLLMLACTAISLLVIAEPMVVYTP